MNPGWYEKTKHRIRYWLLRKLPPCKQAVETISQSMERQLGLKERILLKLHLWVCMWCQWYMEQLQLIRDAAGTVELPVPGEPSSGPALTDDARERIRQRLNNAARDS